MHIELTPSIRNESWYPKDRMFTLFEARIDLLIEIASNSVITLDTEWRLAAKWQWHPADVKAFVIKVRDELRQDSKVSKKICQEVIDVFNQVFDRKITLTHAAERFIRGRIKEGKKMTPPVGVAQFRAVFEFKKEQWEATEQEKYLRISTLCSPTHFFEYLDEAREAYKKKKTQLSQPSGIKIEGVQFKQ